MNGSAGDGRAGDVAARRARDRLDDLTKPVGSLGQLEPLLERIARITERPVPKLERPHLLVFAADHGVTEEDVSAYQNEVTEQMVVNICMGGAVSSVLARAEGVRLTVVDVGVRVPVGHPGAVVRKVAPGTRNLAAGPAMTRAEAEAAVAAGRETAEAALAAGADVLLLGEMGIGNTTAASTLAAYLLDRPAPDVVGRGTGVDPLRLANKRSVVERALALHRPHIVDAWDAMACLGGLELAAMAGVCLLAASRRVPVLLDGFITTAAALWAATVDPAAADVLLASHVSAEPGHRLLLERLGLDPLLRLGLRLGEGSGALLAWPLVQLACRVLAETATFSDARVTRPDTGGRQPEARLVAAGGAGETAVGEAPAQRRRMEVPAEALGEGWSPTGIDFTPAERDAVYKAIFTRRDIRVFLPDPIPDAALMRILEAGHHAPSVGFMQPWNFILVRDRDKREQLQRVAERERLRAADHYEGIRRQQYLRLKVEGLLEAPVTVCVTLDRNRGGPHVLGRNTIPETDLMSAACAIENIWLAARAEGLGVGWVSFYEKADVRRILEIPDGIDPIALLCIGYPPHFPDEPGLQRAGWRARMPLSSVVFTDVWGKGQA
ncbi:nicotinate-nucleotide--dimethylbenzimidazole phosphoribosyltransferase [Alicyclobacillus macrosporangiidus]|uniref:nicotinate-nucleotide--dimethylbenzimidazole phosphoribosyltransferase n=1 Tax=Alicyclobacillus macrosporangiidus TaxID=392015 RepID=UPI0026F2B459|nr:nicotinate-nucleotide--dimethylbenzimidazole phosphoribosyltransferase [Alicyclobacillus macrosporangiidus]